jgi:DNA-binding MarR family transcriptional regulator
MAANRRLRQDEAQAVMTADENKQLSGLPNYFSRPDNGDRLIYEKVRLGIMSSLLVNSHLSFSELKDLLKTSDGNLSVHAKKLEAADYIICSKSFDGRFPKTEYQLTVTGRQAFERYINHMEALIHMARRG